MICARVVRSIRCFSDFFVVVRQGGGRVVDAPPLLAENLEQQHISIIAVRAHGLAVGRRQVNLAVGKGHDGLQAEAQRVQLRGEFVSPVDDYRSVAAECKRRVMIALLILLLEVKHVRLALRRYGVEQRLRVDEGLEKAAEMGGSIACDVKRPEVVRDM